jgi:hypothetical protein
MDGIVASSSWLVQVVRSDGSRRTEVVSISGPGNNNLEEFHGQLLEAAKEQFGNDVVDVENIYPTDITNGIDSKAAE